MSHTQKMNRNKHKNLLYFKYSFESRCSKSEIWRISDGFFTFSTQTRVPQWLIFGVKEQRVCSDILQNTGTRPAKFSGKGLDPQPVSMIPSRFAVRLCWRTGYFGSLSCLWFRIAALGCRGGRLWGFRFSWTCFLIRSDRWGRWLLHRLCFLYYYLLFDRRYHRFICGRWGWGLGFRNNRHLLGVDSKG